MARLRPLAPKLSRHQYHEGVRALGLLVGLTKLGPARRKPQLHRALVRLGVLDRLPESWADSPRLEPLPWGQPRRGDREHSRAAPQLDGPWPTQAIVDPQFSAPVIDLPAEEVRLHTRYNVLRYLGQITALTPGAAARALAGPRIGGLDDARLTDIINTTSLSQLITPLDDDDDLLAELPEQPDPDETWAKIDIRVFDPSLALPGIHCAPTQTLLRYRDGVFHPVLIRFEADPVTVVWPGDGDRWALARYFVTQGLHHLLVVVFHPRMHFPGDAINAISRTLLPPGHRLAKLLGPHLAFALGLNDAVIHHRRSVLHNSQRELYTPFPLTTEGIHAGVGAGMVGVPGRRAYAPYQFQADLLDPRTSYGRYRRDWYTLVRRYVARILSSLSPDDTDVCRWADAIAGWVPGFPDGTKIQQPGALIDAATAYILMVSVFHTADHHSYAAIPLREMPWRLRIPPPNLADPGSLDLAALVSPEDHFRHRLCHAMFFRPVVVRSLRKTRPDYMRPDCRAAWREFVTAMDTLDHRWGCSSFPTSHEIAASLQY